MNEIKTTFINVVEKLKADYKVELGELRKKGICIKDNRIMLFKNAITNKIQDQS